MQETWVLSLGQADPWRRKWQPTPAFLPRESHGQRSLVGYSLCGGCWEGHKATWLRMHTHFKGYLMKKKFLAASSLMRRLKTSNINSVTLSKSFAFSSLSVKQGRCLSSSLKRLLLRMGGLSEIMYVKFLAGPNLAKNSSINTAGGGGALVVISFPINTSGRHRMRSKCSRNRS